MMAQIFGLIHLRFFTSTVIQILKYYNEHFQQGDDLVLSLYQYFPLKWKLKSLESKYYILLWLSEKNKPKCMLIIISTFHSKQLQTRFCNSLTRNWIPVKISQEAKSEQKTWESEAKCSLHDRMRETPTAPVPGPHCVCPLGTQLSASSQQPAPSWCYPLAGASPHLTFDSFLSVIYIPPVLISC
jgi:hypothetical protein